MASPAASSHLPILAEPHEREAIASPQSRSADSPSHGSARERAWTQASSRCHRRVISESSLMVFCRVPCCWWGRSPR